MIIFKTKQIKNANPETIFFYCFYFFIIFLIRKYELNYSNNQLDIFIFTESS